MNAELMLSQKKATVALLGRILVNVIDLTKINLETNKDLSTNKYYVILNRKKLILISLIHISNRRQVGFSLNIVFDLYPLWLTHLMLFYFVLLVILKRNI